MDSATSAKIKNTQSGFPKEATGSVVACPLLKKAAEAKAPVDIETAFAMTQQVLKTMSGSKPVEKAKTKKSWIEIILVDMEGKPVPGVKYRITPPGGAPVEGTLNEHGQAGLYQIDPGSCKVTFPELDKDAWD